MSECVSKIVIEFGNELYEKWRKEKTWYHRIPKKAIKVDVEYVDTRPNENNLPIVLCLHGAPGSHEDFKLLREHLSSHLLRIICPNFPTFHLTKTKGFGHFAEEKTEYICKFLEAIGVKTIDCLISHSSAIYSAILLHETPIGSNLQCLVLLNPSGHRRIKAMKYPLVDSTTGYFYQYKFFRFFIKSFGKPVLILTRCPVKVEMDSIFLSVFAVNHGRYKKLAERLEKLRDKNVKTLMVFSENDKLIEKEIFFEMAKLLGIEQDNFDRYDHNGVHEKVSSGSYPKAIDLECGGHYAFIKDQSKIVNDAIETLIKETLLKNER